MGALRLIRAIVDSLIDINDLDSLVLHYNKIDFNYVTPIAKTLDLPQLAVLDYGLALSAAFYLRSQEILKCCTQVEIENLVKNLSKKISAKNIVVTSGMGGATLVNCKNNSAIFCPAFNQNTIDTVGAGDTFFSICALSIGTKIDNKIVMLLASISASFSINQLGKKFFFNNKNLRKHLTHIFQ